MTEIDSSWKYSQNLDREQFPVDEYHPYSVDWEVIRKTGGPWKIDPEDPNCLLDRISGRRVYREQAQFSESGKPQTGCG